VEPPVAKATAVKVPATAVVKTAVASAQVEPTV